MEENERKQYLEDFGKRVKFYREKLGLTQKELGVKAGYADRTNPSATISKIEKGQIDVTQSKCYDLAKALHVEVYDLIMSPQTARLVKYAEKMMEVDANVDNL